MKGEEKDCGLSRPDALLARAGKIFADRWRVVLLILLIGLAASGACLMLTVGAGLACALFLAPHMAGLVMIMVSGVALALALWFWSQVAMFVAVADPESCSGARACFDSAWTRLPGFLWMGLLWIAAGLGSFSFLVIPGFAVGVWLAFAPLIYLSEDIGAMDALLKSHYYVRGRFWPVAGRLCVIGAANILPGLIPVAGVFLGLLTWPFMSLNLSVLLDELRRLRRNDPFLPSRRGNFLLIGAMVGCFVPALLLGRALIWLAAFSSVRSPGAQMAVINRLLTLATALRGR
jgi:hypothetical protein